jgi:hypothetical protein
MNITTGMPGAHIDPAVGAIRFNTTISTIEMYDGNNWVVTSGVLTQQETPELIMKVGSVAGIVYNCVIPVGKPWVDMFRWCVDMMDKCGNRNADPLWPSRNEDVVLHARWYMAENMFWFRDPEDQMMFVLRWS